jgi:hypothetical protein
MADHTHGPAPAQPEVAVAAPAPLPAGAGVAGLASALGNAGFAALARQSQPRQPAGPVAIDQPKPLLGQFGHAVVRGAVIPRFEAANDAMAAPKPSKGAIETAHANVRQAVSTFRGLGSRGDDTDHPSFLDYVMAETAVEGAEQRMEAIASGNGYAVATQALVRALAKAREGKAAAEQRDGYKGKLRHPDATTPSAADFEADMAAIQAAIQELAGFGPKLSPADAETMQRRLENLIPAGVRDPHRDAVRREVSQAEEGMWLEALGLERAIEGAKRRNADAIEKLEALAATDERVARRRAGERDPVPDWDNPEIPKPPPEPDPDAKPEWI